MKADNFKANVENPQLTMGFSEGISFNQYDVLEEFKRNNPNVVRCIPLDGISSFSLTVNPTEEELEIFEKHGFVNPGTDECGNDFYIRKELLE